LESLATAPAKSSDAAMQLRTILFMATAFLEKIKNSDLF